MNRLDPLGGAVELDEIIVAHDVENGCYEVLEQLHENLTFVGVRVARIIKAIHES